MNQRPGIPRIALTPGEPAGVGPDICITLAQQSLSVELIVVADPDLLSLRASQLGLPLRLSDFEPSRHRTSGEGRLSVLPTPLRTRSRPGELQPANAAYVLETLRRATRGCLQGRFSALVTGPVHKGVINQSGLNFTGHTEFLAELCQAYPVMMLIAPGLRVALATTHLALSEVSSQVTASRLERVLDILHRDLVTRFRIPKPKILVCGLNPHAGEGGHLGTEEIEVIGPVLDVCRNRGMNLRGPLPADTVFTDHNLRQVDAVLAMYHDQGLPVLKHMGFGKAVNVTLGLPIVRTSVDHGTALELAGTGRARPDSLERALAMAVELTDSIQPPEPSVFPP